MKKIVYLDYDGVVVNSKLRMAELYNLYYRPIGAKLIDGEAICTWDAGIDSHLVEPIFASNEFFNYNLKEFNGIYDSLQMLKDKNYEIILYSKGSLLNIMNKSEWCFNELKNYLDGWIFTGSNDLKMGKNQYDMSVEDGFSILLDDHSKNLICEKDSKHFHHMPTYSICCKFSGDTKKGAIEEEWNKDFTDEKFTIYNWNELEKIIDMIENFEYNIIV